MYPPARVEPHSPQHPSLRGSLPLTPQFAVSRRGVFGEPALSLSNGPSRTSVPSCRDLALNPICRMTPDPADSINLAAQIHTLLPDSATFSESSCAGKMRLANYVPILDGHVPR